MCIRVYMWVYMCVRICVYLDVCVCLCICASVCACLCVSVCAYVCEWKRLHFCFTSAFTAGRSTGMCVSARLLRCVCARAHMCVNVYVCVYVRMRCFLCTRKSSFFVKKCLYLDFFF